MSDEEDDYMSASFVVPEKKDVRPGLFLNHSLKRKHELEKKSLEANKRSYTKSRQQLEEESRSEALNRPLTEENRGFSMLKKMGYKPGMTLGKQASSALKEPIAIEVKAGREGLGRSTERKEKLLLRKQQKQMVLEDPAFEEKFRRMAKSKALEKYIITDLRKSQRVCSNLDQTRGISVPEKSWYWPEYMNEKTEDDSEEDEDYAFLNEMDEDEELEEEDDTQEEPTEQLKVLTSYLRSSYFYCIWCGIQFNDAEDMETNCPGSTREDHDE